MKKAIVTMVLVNLGLVLLAQENERKNRFELEIDPIAYVLNGYSVHGIYVFNKTRFDVGIFGIEQPEGFDGNNGFKVEIKGVGAKINFLLNKKETWFAGVGFGYAGYNVNLLNSNESKSQEVVSGGVHLGYRWFAFNKAKNAFKNIYLAPWFSVDYNNPLTKVSFSNPEFKQTPISVFPTVHIGYKF